MDKELNELSKKTLSDYIKKSSHDVATLGAVTRQLSNDARDARQVDDFSTARKKEGQANKVFAKSWNRRKGMAKAVDRLTKEDIEEMTQDEFDSLVENFDQLDELSKKTLGDYIKSASKDATHAARSVGRHGTLYSVTGSQQEKNFKNISVNDKNKRLKGIAKATDRLTKESINDLIHSLYEGIDATDLFNQLIFEKISDLVENRKEQIDELSKDTFKSYIKKAVRDSNLASRSAGYHGALSHSSYDDATKRSNADWSKEGIKHKNKRSKGIDKALDRLTRESVEDSEQIDELSKTTLSSYVNKAKEKRNYLDDKSEAADDRGDYKTAATQHARANKVQSGIDAARKRLAKNNGM